MTNGNTPLSNGLVISSGGNIAISSSIVPAQLEIRPSPTHDIYAHTLQGLERGLFTAEDVMGTLRHMEVLKALGVLHIALSEEQLAEKARALADFEVEKMLKE